jgi:hypothetical protein
MMMVFDYSVCRLEHRLMSLQRNGGRRQIGLAVT